jgi:Raf kinase inhibitor-like YbhB/YbcL family protein
MRLVSPAFKDQERIPVKYTCHGEKLSPPLLFEDAPEDARFFALVVEDPDVPKQFRADGMWNHWLAWNIPAAVDGLPEGEPAPGVVGRSTGGTYGYEPPCPPDREHRYIFSLYALGEELPLGKDATKEELLAEISKHVIAKTELLGLYAPKA